MEALVSRLEVILDHAGIPRSLGEAGVDTSHIPMLADEAARQWTAQFNPRSCGITDFVALYDAAANPRSAARR